MIGRMGRMQQRKGLTGPYCQLSNYGQRDIEEERKVVEFEGSYCLKGASPRLVNCFVL
jgi:hypothetical protein